MKTEKLLDVPLDDIKVGTRYRKDYGDLSPLETSIDAIGVLQPVGVTEDLKLIFGARRLKACRNLGRETIPARVISLDCLIQGEHDENSEDIRKPFTNSEKLAIAKAIKAELGDRRGQRTDLKVTSGQLAGSPKGETRDVAAKAAGFSSTQEMRRAEVVEEKCCQDIKDAVDDGTVSLSDAAAVSNERREVQEAAIQKVLYGEAPTLNAAVKMVHDDREEAGVEAEPILDLLGNPVPDHLMPIMEDNLLFAEIAESVKAIRRQLDALDKRPSSSHRKVGELQALCLTIERRMVEERFGFACPACAGNGMGCKCCQGRRWFVVGDKDKVPKIRRAS
jgi:hypothetical protein